MSTLCKMGKLDSVRFNRCGTELTFEFFHNSHLIRRIKQKMKNRRSDQGLNPDHLLSSQTL